VKRTSSVVLVLVLIACGGSAETSTTTTAPTASTTTTTDGGSATTADEGNGGLPSGDCLSLSTTLSQASMLGLNPTSEDPGDTVQALQNMADAAPAEIADDLETLAAAYGDFLAALEEAGVDFADPTTYSSPAAQAALATASQALDTAGVAEASANISAYIDSVCE
jgi:hypothetical protein